MDRVLVTGSNGHVGYNLVKELVARGYRVRASVRDANDHAKAAPLRELGAEVVSADVLEPDTLRAAMCGMDGVFQIAAVYRFHSRDPQREIIAPSVEGARNVMHAVRGAGVRKIVFTSSTMAVGARAPEGRPLDERDWNDDATEPYMIAKTRGERTAWEIAERDGTQLVVVNPTSVIGPGFFRHTPSTQVFESAMRGDLVVLPPFFYSYVDVRDVATAHRLAYESQVANGRYILADRHVTMPELMALVREIDPRVRVPRLVVPRRLLGAAVIGDAVMHRLRGKPRLLTREMCAELGGSEQRVSSERARRELGWISRDLRQSIADTMAWIRERFMGEARA